MVLILIFSVNLGWFPSSGAYDVGMADSIGNRMKHMILPLVVMIFSHLWYYAYMIRNKFLDEVRKDYVLLARSKGLSKRKILWKHCLRNVMPTIVSIMAVSVPHVTAVLNDTLSVCKVTQFENLLRIWNKEKILEKTEKVHLPFHMDMISSDAYVEQLVWSELGDYIRELLRKERS